MKKIFMGVRLRALREERQLSQTQLARLLEISTSYLNQIEHNDRPLTARVLLRLQTRLGVDPQFFSDDNDARVLAQLRDALVDQAVDIPLAELQTMVQQTPQLADAFLRLHSRCRSAEERLDAVLADGSDERHPSTLRPALQPHEEVRDFFYARHNYIDSLDRAAEKLHEKLNDHGTQSGNTPPAVTNTATLNIRLISYLKQQHQVEVRHDDGDDIRRFDPALRLLTIAPNLEQGQQTFQLAVQLAHLEMAKMLEEVAEQASFSSDSALALARIGLASYFAGALVLPYRAFLREAESLRYDVDLLADRFGVSYETVCHRLSTLQRPEALGVPFFFVRVDRAGNISKRQSATDFHFSRTGGTCPLWAVYEAFSQPDRILTQLARMPDERTYLWIARAITHRTGGYGTPARTFAIGLGCDLQHATRLVYAKSLNLQDPEAATPIGPGCKVCDRRDCSQRAFPAIGRALATDPNSRKQTPYAME